MCFKIKKNILFIPGCPKSGTTTLYEILSQHERIAVPFIKEPQYFALRYHQVKKYYQWYHQLFTDGSDKILVDASTFYYPSDQAVLNISKCVQNPLFIFILRDPAKRAYSAFLHMSRKVPRADKRRFLDIISELNTVSFEEIQGREDECIHSAIRDGKIISTYLDKNYLRRVYGVDIDAEFDDHLWLFKYFQTSVYTNNIKRYRDVFGERVKIIFFEKLLQHPQETFIDIFHFLQLDPIHVMSELPHANKTALPRNWIARNLLLMVNEFKKKSVKGDALPAINAMKKRIKKLFYISPKKIDQKSYELSRQILENEYKYWYKQNPELENLWQY